MRDASFPLPFSALFQFVSPFFVDRLISRDFSASSPPRLPLPLVTHIIHHQVNCVDLLWSSILSGLTSGSAEAEEGGPEDPAEGEGRGGIVFDSVEGAVVSPSSVPAAGGASPSAAATATAVEKRRAKA